MDTELFKGLDQGKHFSTTRLPRAPRPVPTRIDTDDSPEEYQKRIEAKEKSERMIAGILQARDEAKAIQKQINELRSERAKIKGQSKDSKSKRQQVDLLIATLRSHKEAT